jgi:DNA polymerase-3 subunit alpha
MLFGEDYLKFKDYLVDGWFLFVRGSVEQRRFRDDPNDVEYKVRHIELLADVREKFIARLRLQIDITALDEARLDHLGSLVEQHPGQVGLTLEMHDNGTALEMPSRTRKIELNDGFVEALEALVVEGGVKYRLEMAKQ